MKNYETVFILTPVLSEEQMKDAANGFVKVLEKAKAKVINTEFWGLKKMAYRLQGKSTGFYNLIEFEAEPSVVDVLETQFRRDERVLRFLTVTLDKHAVKYNEKRRKGEFKKVKVKEEVTA